ncbi:hypothetical protein E2C01_016738 [Portunus trituberculatus]|uniref:Uncharacterized protein n=1 Tax=Portunus trituberculatus TaxID=210409 RepID=A0A5B7DQM1_PORTR|nr:hypothetical protein [Portunus trituberculatus]
MLQPQCLGQCQSGAAGLFTSASSQSAGRSGDTRVSCLVLEGPMQQTQEKSMGKNAEASTNHAQPASPWNNKPSNTRSSTPASVGGGEDKYSPLNKIPYEPRTKFVKNLKEKLETNYMKDKSDQRTSVETGAALREEEGYEDSPRHQANQRHHKHHGKKCLHRYQQNERLFLEPTIVNRKGQSLCAECSAPQPRNPHREPYLYHITLGGLKTNGDKRLGTASINGFSNWGKENNRVSNMKSKKVSADKSRFVYAKLNDRIDNVLGGKNLHSEHSAQLSSPISSYTKRPPSRSMALMDHII